MAEELDRQMIAFIAGIRAATGCWKEGEGEATDLKTAADFEKVLSSLARYCYQIPPPAHCQEVIPSIAAVLATKINNERR